MGTHLHLLITTMGYVISMLVVLGFGFFVFFQKERKTVNYIWLGFTLALAFYQLAFIIGVNTPATSKIAYWIWYTNIAEDILIGLFTIHILILASDGLGKFKHLLYFSFFLFPKWKDASHHPREFILFSLGRFGCTATKPTLLFS